MPDQNPTRSHDAQNPSVDRPEVAPLSNLGATVTPEPLEVLAGGSHDVGADLPSSINDLTGTTTVAPENRDVTPEGLANRPYGIACGTVVQTPEHLAAVAIRSIQSAQDFSSVSVPGYEVVGELGQGGMGVVYKARQAALNRTVALKLLLNAAHTQPILVARFMAEAEAVAAIDHPHVVRVHQYGEYECRPFLAMEYLPGGTLVDRLKVSTFPTQEAATLVAKLAAGVGAAHALGIVHRDLKPGNVLFDVVGEPKVADFGLARRGTGADLTRTDAMMGTPAYMPPEQIRGAKFAGPPADVWALGVILYECLTGARPFKADDLDGLVYQIAHVEPVSPSRVKPDVPRDLELICLKCLAKAPGDRYQTAAALADDLNRFIAGEPVGVRTAGAGERILRWTRRNPALASVYALSVLVLVLGGFGAATAWLWRDAEGARANAASVLVQLVQEKEVAERATEGERAAKDRLAAVGYARSVALAFQQVQAGHPTRAVTLLESCPSGFRGWEWDFVRARCDASALTIRGHKGIVYSVRFSTDGKRVHLPCLHSACRRKS